MEEEERKEREAAAAVNAPIHDHVQPFNIFSGNPAPSSTPIQWVFLFNSCDAFRIDVNFREAH
jgi:hypothetical protein